MKLITDEYLKLVNSALVDVNKSFIEMQENAVQTSATLNTLRKEELNTMKDSLSGALESIGNTVTLSASNIVTNFINGVLKKSLDGTMGEVVSGIKEAFLPLENIFLSTIENFATAHGATIVSFVTAIGNAISIIATPILAVGSAVAGVLAWVLEGFNNLNPAFAIAGTAISTVSAAFLIQKSIMVTTIAYTALVTAWNNVMSASWWNVNVAMLACPIVWVIAGVVSIIALISFLIYKIDGWGNIWTVVIQSMRLAWLMLIEPIQASIDSITLQFLNLKRIFDDGADAEIAIVEKRLIERAEERKTIQKTIGENAAQVKWNDKTLEDFTKDLKTTIGVETSPKPYIVGTAGAMAIDKITNSPLSGIEGQNNFTNPVNLPGNSGKTITINKLVENLNIHVSRLSESKEEIRQMITEILISSVEDTKFAYK